MLAEEQYFRTHAHMYIYFMTHGVPKDSSSLWGWIRHMGSSLGQLSQLRSICYASSSCMNRAKRSTARHPSSDYSFSILRDSLHLWLIALSDVSAVACDLMWRHQDGGPPLYWCMSKDYCFYNMLLLSVHMVYLLSLVCPGHRVLHRIPAAPILL